MASENFSEILTCDELNTVMQDPYVSNIVNNISTYQETESFNPEQFQLLEFNPNDMQQQRIKTEVPLLPPNILCTEEYPGPLNFEACVIPLATKQPWVFSSDLCKVFMDINSPFPIDFKINNWFDASKLFVRATPLFSSPQFAQDPVYRCIQHEHNDREPNTMVNQHIIRCNNSAAFYMGDKNKNERLSILIPMGVPQSGVDSVREMFVFVCKNSCPSPGMNRRPIQVVFTLEDIGSNVLGRRVLNVRICSCPKRDKEKEEEEFRSKNGNNPAPHGKKRKLDKSAKKVPQIENTALDKREFRLNLNIIGKHNQKKLLEYARDLMEAEIGKRDREDESSKAPYRKCLTAICSQISKYPRY